MSNLAKSLLIAITALFLCSLFIEPAGHAQTVYIRRSGTPTPTPTPFWSASVSNVTTSDTSVVSSNASDQGYANSAVSISSGGTGYFQFDATSTLPNYFAVQLRPAAGAPYTTSTGSEMWIQVESSGFIQFNDPGYSGNTAYNSSNVIRIGFDGSNHMRVWKDGVVQYTTSGTYTTANYILWIYHSYSDPVGTGLENMSVVP